MKIKRINSFESKIEKEAKLIEAKAQEEAKKKDSNTEEPKDDELPEGGKCDCGEKGCETCNPKEKVQESALFESTMTFDAFTTEKSECEECKGKENGDDDEEDNKKMKSFEDFI